MFYGMLVLGDLSHHIISLTTLKLPCCEEAKPHSQPNVLMLQLAVVIFESS